MLGAFREMIEPQVRDAVSECQRKGYPTESSGFGGEFDQIQSLDGYFKIDEETKKKIEALDAKVLTRKELGLPGESEQYTCIQFQPSHPDINEIKEKWDAIAALLPPKAGPRQPSISGGAEDFRKQYAANRTDIASATLQRRRELENTV